MNKLSALCFLTLATLSGRSASAQFASTELREVHQAVYDASSTPTNHYGALRSMPNGASGFAQIAWDFENPSGGGATTYVMTTTLNRIGYLTRVSSTDFLVAGQRFLSGGGYVGHLALVRLDLVNPALNTVQSGDVGAVDLIDLHYDKLGGRLFGIDARGRRLVASPWTPTGSLPSSFSQVFGYATLPALANPLMASLEANGDAAGVRVYHSDGVRYARCTSSSSGWSCDTTSWQSELRRPVITTDSRFLALNQPWPLRVYGPGALPSSASVQAEGFAQASVAVNGVNPIACPIPTNASPGAFGSIELGTTELSEPLDFRTCVRYGVAQNTAFYPLGETYCDVFGPFTNRTNLVISAKVLPHATNGVTQAPAIVGELRIGFRDANGVDPVVMNGNSATLSAALAIPFSVPGGDLPRDLSVSIPQIPGGLEGVTTLFQFVVTDGSQFSQTDVFGIEIRATDPWN
mgnify:CR=1 FL=1